MTGSSFSTATKTAAQGMQSAAATTFKTVGDLIRLLPTGTVFLFQFLNPVLTNYGSCSVANKVVTGVLLAICGFNCAFVCFTDSYVGTDGAIHYGIITATGLLPFWDPSPPPASSLALYRLRFSDFVYAIFTVVVFAVVSLLDPNSVGCFYPGFKSASKAALMAIPPVIGVVSVIISTLFPNSRHWVGYPPATTTVQSSSTTASA